MHLLSYWVQGLKIIDRVVYIEANHCVRERDVQASVKQAGQIVRYISEIDKASYDYYKITLYISISKDLVLYNCTAKQHHVTLEMLRGWTTLILVVMTTITWYKRRKEVGRSGMLLDTRLIFSPVNVLASLKLKLRLVTTKSSRSGFAKLRFVTAKLTLRFHVTTKYIQEPRSVTTKLSIAYIVYKYSNWTHDWAVQHFVENNSCYVDLIT